VFALVFVLALSIGFAQAAEPKPLKATSLRSSSVIVLDAGTGEIVIDKNSGVVVPIASITKLMTAMVILDRGLELDQRIVLSREDVDSRKGSRSRLRSGTVLTRDELLLLALMASENMSAAALGRTYPGGIDAFAGAMNEKAEALGMTTAASSTHGLGATSERATRVGQRRARLSADPRVPRSRATVKVYGRPMTFGKPTACVQHAVEHRPVEDRLHQRGGPPPRMR
jgi:D-alanyl-D-alanine endopeptidase (penicillin-binding protein 7)